MAGVQIEDDEDHLIVIDAPFNQHSKVQSIPVEDDFVRNPPGMDEFKARLLQEEIVLDQAIAVKVTQQQQVMEAKILEALAEPPLTQANDLEVDLTYEKNTPTEQALSFQSTLSIEEVDNFNDLMHELKLDSSISINSEAKTRLDARGQKIAQEVIVDSYRTLVIALNDFNSPKQIKFREQTFSQFEQLKIVLQEAKASGHLLNYLQAHNRLKAFTLSESFIALSASMIHLSQLQNNYLFNAMQGVKFHRELSDQALKSASERLLKKGSKVTRSGVFPDKRVNSSPYIPPTKKEKEAELYNKIPWFKRFRIDWKKHSEESYKNDLKKAILKLSIGNFQLEDEASLSIFNDELTAATTVITKDKRVYKRKEIQTISDARIAIEAIKAFAKVSISYVQQRLIDPEEYLGALDRKTPLSELMSLQKQQLEIAQVHVIDYRKNLHAPQQLIVEQLRGGFKKIAIDNSLSANDLVKKLAELKALKISLTESIVVSKLQTEKFINQHEKQKSIINHKCFVAITDNKDKDEVLAFTAQAIKEARRLQENQQALLVAITEEENKSFAEFDLFRAELPTVYDQNYYSQSNIDYETRCDAADTFKWKMVSQGLHYPLEDYAQLVAARAEQEMLLHELKAFIDGMDKSIEQLSAHHRIITENYPDKKSLIAQLTEQLSHLQSMKVALIAKQDKAINAYIYTKKMMKVLGGFYLNDAQLVFNALEVNELFVAAKLRASFNYLLDEGSNLQPQDTSIFEVQAQQKIAVIENLQTKLQYLPLTAQGEALQAQLAKAHEQLSLVISQEVTSILDYDSVQIDTPNFTTLAQRDQAVLDFKALLLRKPAEIDIIKYSAIFFKADEYFINEIYQVLIHQQHQLAMDPLGKPDALCDLLDQRIQADIWGGANKDLAVIKTERWVQLLSYAEKNNNKDLCYAIYSGLVQTFSGNALFLKNLPPSSQAIIGRMSRELVDYEMLGLSPSQEGDESFEPDNSTLQAELFLAENGSKVDASALLRQVSDIYSDGVLASYDQATSTSLFSREAQQALIKNPQLYQMMVDRQWVLNANATLADYAALNSCFLKKSSMNELTTAIEKIVLNKIPDQDLVAIHKANNQHVHHAYLENTVLKTLVKDQIIQSTSLLRYFSDSYGTSAKIEALNAAIVQPVSDSQFKALLADVGLVLTDAQLKQVQAENKALTEKRALITLQAAELSATSAGATAPEEQSRLQRWTQQAKANPVKSALLAVSACVLFKPVLVAASAVAVMEVLRPADKPSIRP